MSPLPKVLAENGFLGRYSRQLISRDDEFAGNPEIAMTNQSNREWVYRSAFELGRHVIGYEVQKVLAAVDLLTKMERTIQAVVTNFVSPVRAMAARSRCTRQPSTTGLLQF